MFLKIPGTDQRFRKETGKLRESPLTVAGKLTGKHQETGERLRKRPGNSGNHLWQSPGNTRKLMKDSERDRETPGIPFNSRWETTMKNNKNMKINQYTIASYMWIFLSNLSTYKISIGNTLIFWFRNWKCYILYDFETATIAKLYVDKFDKNIHI